MVRFCCSRALSLNSKNHVLFSNRSAAYVGLEQYRKALADANSCIKISPNFVKGYSRQAYAYLKLNKPGFAEKAYRQGLQLDPTYAALKQGLASLLKVLYLFHTVLVVVPVVTHDRPWTTLSANKSAHASCNRTLI